MIDLHTHTFLSDGVLNPSELARRAEMAGYRILGIADHVDESNVSIVIPALVRAADAINSLSGVKVVPGCEITHVHPDRILSLVAEARNLGAKMVIVHGETISEPVIHGTNLAGIEAGADMIAHPGLITDEVAKKAAEKGVLLEITARQGSSLTNGHVAKTAVSTGAKLGFSSDSHQPEDLVTVEFRRSILAGAGLTNEQIETVLKNMEELGDRIL